MGALETREGDPLLVEIHGVQFRAVEFDGELATIMTGPAVTDRVARIVAEHFEIVAAAHPGHVLTLAQVAIGVSGELMCREDTTITDHFVSGTHVGSAAELAREINGITHVDHVTHLMHTTYDRRSKEGTL